MEAKLNTFTVIFILAFVVLISNVAYAGVVTDPGYMPPIEEQALLEEDNFEGSSDSGAIINSFEYPNTVVIDGIGLVNVNNNSDYNLSLPAAYGDSGSSIEFTSTPLLNKEERQRLSREREQHWENEQRQKLHQDIANSEGISQDDFYRGIYQDLGGIHSGRYIEKYNEERSMGISPYDAHVKIEGAIEGEKLPPIEIEKVTPSTGGAFDGDEGLS